MKNICKKIIGIILIAIIAFAGIEIFRKNDHEEANNNTINVNSEDINRHFYRKMILDNTICEYKNFITLIEGLEHACNR